MIEAKYINQYGQRYYAFKGDIMVTQGGNRYIVYEDCSINDNRVMTAKGMGFDLESIAKVFNKHQNPEEFI